MRQSVNQILNGRHQKKKKEEKRKQYRNKEKIMKNNINKRGMKKKRKKSFIKVKSKLENDLFNKTCNPDNTNFKKIVL